MDYLLRIENSIQPCWIDLSIDGDPGRTCDISNATRFETENLARENKTSIQSKYNRKIVIVIESYNAELSRAGTDFKQNPDA